MNLWSRQSIGVKLPVAIALLLLIAFGAMTTAVYFAVRDTLVDIASNRLANAASQLSGVLAISARQRAGVARQLAGDPIVVAYLQHPDAAQDEAVRAAIVRHLGATADLAIVELWDAAGGRKMVVGTAPNEIDPAHAQELMKIARAATVPVFSNMWAAGKGTVTPIAAAVRDERGVIGFVIERRRGGANPAQTANLLSGLIGAEATILVGNQDGSAWTDLVAPVSGPPVSVADATQLFEYQREGRPPTFARASPVPDTPWTTLIEFPTALVLAPARQFLNRAIITMLVVVVLASGLAFIFSRRITTPLRQVTEAAEAVAEARHAVKVTFSREDELGRLAESFNTMAARVEHSRQQYETLVNELEHRVDARTSELQEANRELEAFSYSVSHDLRAPVRAIAGFVQILEDDHSAKLDAEATRTLGVVKRNANRMGRLIDDLLDFARLGRTSLARSRVDMNALARSVADDVLRHTGGTQPDITIETLPDASGEATLVQQVLVNLISNAVKFSSKQASPRIQVGSTRNEAGEIVYFVRDNGVGFDMKFAGQLFGVFKRLHQGEGFDGTGVGLAIIHRIVTKHGGRVWAEGEVGKGATFYFTLAAQIKTSEPQITQITPSEIHQSHR